MDLRRGLSRVRSFISIVLFRLISGRYSRKAGIGIGIVGAVLLAVLGYILGPGVNRIILAVPPAPPLLFKTGELTVLWGVHATVISLSLVGLSFAWNSVLNLPTTDTIIAEIAYRLRSIETITFLLTSNLCIGAGVLLSSGEFVTPEIGFPVGLLLVSSIVVTVHRFWIVFDLLLHNTLDEKVSDFADAALSGKSRATASEYDVYLGYFFDASRKEIGQDRPDRLREKLRGVEDLLDGLIASNSSLKNNGQFWEYVSNNYDSIYRRSVTQQNPELENQVIASISGVFWKSQNYGDPGLSARAVQFFSTLFVRGYSMEPQSRSGEFLLERFGNAQRRILIQFKNAENAQELDSATALVENLLETHASMWRTAAENEAIGAVDYLRQMLDDIYEFQEYSYAPPQPIRERDGMSEDSFEAEKQTKADSYRTAISRLRFATYGWVLHLFEEEDVSDYFLEQVFTKYLENDFGSVHRLSEMYFQMGGVQEDLNYWERWNLDRALDNRYGVASAGMAMNTWLLRFYCTALIWIVDDEETVESLQTRDAGDSPLTDYDHIQHRVDEIINLLESYKTGYPLTELLGGGPAIEERCDTLIDYFEVVKSVLDEQERDWVRELPISDGAVDGLRESVDSQLDSCALRTAIQEVSGITQVETFDGDDSVGFDQLGSSARNVFVDDGITTFFTNNFSGLIDRYRRLVLDNLELDERELDSSADLPDELAQLISDEDVALIVVENMDSARILQDEERSERAVDNDVGSHFEFMDIPVLRDVTTEFDAIVLFEEDLEYVEEADRYPISVVVTPGEAIDDWDEEDVPDGEDIRDYAQIEYSYKARIHGSSTNGVVFRVSEGTVGAPSPSRQ